MEARSVNLLIALSALPDGEGDADLSSVQQ